MFKTRAWNGCGYKEYVSYLIRECHMDIYDATREAADEFRGGNNADNNTSILRHNICNGVGVLSNR